MVSDGERPHPMSSRQKAQMVVGIICLSFTPILAVLQLSGYYKPPLYQWLLVGALTFPAGFRSIRQARASGGAQSSGKALPTEGQEQREKSSRE